jgi:hypothetical protein
MSSTGIAGGVCSQSSVDEMGEVALRENELELKYTLGAVW